jgi:hypothetical protein
MNETTAACKICGNPLDAGAANCTVCGATYEQATTSTQAPQKQSAPGAIPCKACGQEIPKTVKTCPKCGAKNNKPVYKQWWFWLVAPVVLFVVLFIAIFVIDDNSYTPDEFHGEPYKKVETIFKDAGFTNIELVEVGTTDWSGGWVDGVTINGKTIKNIAEAEKLAKTEKLGNDSKVSIFYESFAAAAANATDAVQTDDAAAAAANATEAAQTEVKTEASTIFVRTSTDKHIAYVPNFVGRNASQVGTERLSGAIMTDIGKASIDVIFITPDGSLITADNAMNYKVVAQDPAPDTEISITFDTDSDGEEYDSLVDYASLDCITVLLSKASDKTAPSQALTPISISKDYHTAYVPNYVGRNASQVGTERLSGAIMTDIGKASIDVIFITPDGSLITADNAMNYKVVAQDPAPNTEIAMTFSTDSDGEEYSWPNWKSINSITVTLEVIK